MCCSHPYGVSFEDATSSFPFTSIKPGIGFFSVILCKKKKGGKKAAWLTEYGSHKGQLGGMEKKKKKCVRAHVYAGGTTVCFVKRRDGNKAMGVKLS